MSVAAASTKGAGPTHHADPAQLLGRDVHRLEERDGRLCEHVRVVRRRAPRAGNLLRPVDVGAPAGPAGRGGSKPSADRPDVVRLRAREEEKGTHRPWPMNFGASTGAPSARTMTLSVSVRPARSIARRRRATSAARPARNVSASACDWNRMPYCVRERASQKKRSALRVRGNADRRAGKGARSWGGDGEGETAACAWTENKRTLTSALTLFLSDALSTGRPSTPRSASYRPWPVFGPSTACSRPTRCARSSPTRVVLNASAICDARAKRGEGSDQRARDSGPRSAARGRSTFSRMVCPTPQRSRTSSGSRNASTSAGRRWKLPAGLALRVASRASRTLEAMPMETLFGLGTRTGGGGGEGG